MMIDRIIRINLQLEIFIILLKLVNLQKSRFDVNYKREASILQIQNEQK